MGVTSLWPILSPCARPTPLPTLNRTRLAVDASIWIYQFLKAVRDKEGNALRNSHVVGFFRRICKLLFFGIKPVFVFDGGAPALKRQTVLGRKRRREGRRDDAVRTAGKLLAVQMQRRVEEEEERRTRQKEVTGRSADSGQDEEEVPADGQLVYVDEIGMSASERAKTRKFTKKDAYHLPDLTNGIEGMGQPNDPRIMSAEELEEYARQFNRGEDINLYDFSKIDFNGEFFTSLPAVDRYNILNAARLRSRLRMGLSKDQLEEMFPDRMEFSKFQIDRVRERNELTQRLMNLNGMNGDDSMFGLNGGGRIAGDQKREYVLVKNEGVEGGWALGVVSTDKDAGKRNKPIDVDELSRNGKVEQSDNDGEDEEDFEDVPIEGLNRLPQIRHRAQNSYRDDDTARAMAESRKTFYKTQKGEGNGPQATNRGDDIDSLFVEADDGETRLSRDTLPFIPKAPLGDDSSDNEEEELNRAIAMSLQKQHASESESDDENAEFEDVQIPTYQQRAVADTKPLPKAGGLTVAHVVNNRASASVPKRRAPSTSSNEDMDLQTVLATSRKENSAKRMKPTQVAPLQNRSFNGPLPFEKFDFRGQLLGKKKANPEQAVDGEHEEHALDMEGGFQREDAEDSVKPLPPWLTEHSDIRSEYRAQQARDIEDNAADRARREEEARLFKKNHGVIHVDSDDDSNDMQIAESRFGDRVDLTAESTQISEPPMPENEIETAGELAEAIRAEPPQPVAPDHLPSDQALITDPYNAGVREESSQEDFVEWSDSDRAESSVVEGRDRSPVIVTKTSSTGLQQSRSRSPSYHLQTEEDSGETTRVKSLSPVFEDVDMPDATSAFPGSGVALAQEAPPLSAGDVAFDEQVPDLVSDVDFDEFSDPDDEELLAQLAIEAEEHARFASTLNNKSEKENQEQYERELKALRNQQKKDRRDADEVSHIMIQECQALLRLFGLPYITAPMEAEAQCAELVRLGLVDGIVTDDSDVFLFGGTRVYKNMFNSNKFVECYLAADIEKELSLSRNSLIGIAQLLGSDYTEGLPGIGPVTALEILSEFSDPEKGLNEFKEWWAEVQTHPAESNTRSWSAFRNKFRRQQGKKLFLPPAFPSEAVRLAYLQPEVDSTPEAFQWGVPDLEKLRDFLMATIGWNSERTDEVLVPVIKDMNRREIEGTQANITRYFHGGVGVGAREGQVGDHSGSVRMQNAVKKLKAKKRGGTEPRALVGTFGSEAADWAKKNELTDKAQKEKDAARKRRR